MAVNVASLSLKPNIIHIIADDLGWAQLGYHNEVAATLGEVKTPIIDQLIKLEALELDRFYTEKICSPSRCSFQTGRLGIHVNAQNIPPNFHNPFDKISGYQGAPLFMSTIAEMLRSSGYSTHLVGKWDIGMATDDHTPAARGYDTFLGYFHHTNDYWSHSEGTCSDNISRDPGVNKEVDSTTVGMYDLWRSNLTYNGPAYELTNGADCSDANQSPDGQICRYEDDILLDEVLKVISTHDKTHASSTPLFLVYTMHLVHFPLEVPQQQLNDFSYIDNPFRQRMAAMTNLIDQYVGQIVDSLKSIPGMWENSIVVFHGDNGGDIFCVDTCAGNNYPLRGGKFSTWEGGIRSPVRRKLYYIMYKFIYFYCINRYHHKGICNRWRGPCATPRTEEHRADSHR